LGDLEPDFLLFAPPLRGVDRLPYLVIELDALAGQG